MTQPSLRQILDERPLRMAPGPELPRIPVARILVQTKPTPVTDDRVGTGAVVLLTALVFWTAYFLMQRFAV